MSFFCILFLAVLSAATRQEMIVRRAIMTQREHQFATSIERKENVSSDVSMMSHLKKGATRKHL